MAHEARRTRVVAVLLLALLAPVAAQAAGGQAKRSLVSTAVAFVQTLGKGDFGAAEADFTSQMKQAAPPDRLREIWQGIVNQFGAYQDTGNSRTVTQVGYTTVIVDTDFKSRALGIAVSFDSAGRIAGMHLVPPS